MDELREKVIRGLEMHKSGLCNTLTPNGKEYCPYWENDDNCMVALLTDALSLLKTQEPRVMTLDEVKQAKGRDIWLEMSSKIAEDVITAATIESCDTVGICTRYKSLNYGKYCVKPYGWRCWTSRPTDAQREAVKWE